MKNLIIRKATLSDLKDIQVLNNDLFEYETKNGYDSYVKDWALGKKSADYFTDLINNQFVIVAQEGQEAVGYLAGSIYKDNTYSYYKGLTAELENMFLKEKYRKFGLGSKLINKFLEWCKSNNVKRVFVTASIGNEGTINFYKKNGFNNINLTLKKDL